MSNINKQALRNTADRDWFESWFKSEFHPDKTGPYIKDQLFFAIQAARKPLLDELEAAEKRIAELEARTLTVKLPISFNREIFGDGMYEVPNGNWMHRKDVKEALDSSCAAAGIKLQIEE